MEEEVNNMEMNLENMLASAYTQILTRRELEDYVHWLRSPSGQSILVKRPWLKAAGEEIGEKWGNIIAERVVARTAELTE